MTGDNFTKIFRFKDDKTRHIKPGSLRLLSCSPYYRDNRFSQFDTRQTASDTDESHELIQLLRLL